MQREKFGGGFFHRNSMPRGFCRLYFFVFVTFSFFFSPSLYSKNPNTRRSCPAASSATGADRWHETTISTSSPSHHLMTSSANFLP